MPLSEEETRQLAFLEKLQASNSNMPFVPTDESAAGRINTLRVHGWIEVLNKDGVLKQDYNHKTSVNETVSVRLTEIGGKAIVTLIKKRS